MINYKKINVAEEARTELHQQLNLTGAEISINLLPAGSNIPFIHSHKQNEEIYAILEGEGKAVIDNETICLQAGDWIRISPAAKRQFFASQTKAMKYFCIQVKENSLKEFTLSDAIIH